MQVKCTFARLVHCITQDKTYEVLAVEGDIDPVCGGFVEHNGMILEDDQGSLIYAVYPECLFGVWEVVSED